MPFAYDLMGETKPEVFVELGVHWGDSYFTFCQARREHGLKTLCYAVDTWKGDSQAGEYGEAVYEDVNRNNSEHYSDFSYLLRMSFDMASDQFKNSSIDLLHIDGLHTYEAVSEDFKTWFPKIKPGGIILLHDMVVRQSSFGVWKLWDEIKQQFPHFWFEHGHGLGILQVAANPRTYVQVGKLVLDSQDRELIWKNYAIAYELIKNRRLLSQGKKTIDNFQLQIDQKDQEIDQKDQEIDQKDQALNATQEKMRYLHGQTVSSYKSIKKMNEAIIDLNLHLGRIRNERNSLVREVGILREKTIGRITFGWISSAFSVFRKFFAFRLKKDYESTHWQTPQLPIVFKAGKVTLDACICLNHEDRIKEAFISLGKRIIACNWQPNPTDRDKNINRTRIICEFNTGTGPKLCRLFVVLDDGSTRKVGSRLILSFKPKTNKVNFVTKTPKCGYQNWLACNQSSASHRRAWEKHDSVIGDQTLFSFVMPVYNPHMAFLKDAILSVMDQTYNNWEICITDDASGDKNVVAYLKHLAKQDSRVKLHLRDDNGGIACATNDAIDLARGEFLVFIDQDDLVATTALSEINAYLEQNPNTDFLYTDDDKIDQLGNRYSPQFKPDWSPELLLSYCYVSHMKVVRSETSVKIGHVREGFDGSQDYDYALRLTEQCRNIGHIPKILYHWRAIPGSTASDGSAKPNAFISGCKSVADACKRRGINASVSHPYWAQKEQLGIFKMDFPDEGPEVTILIPTRNNSNLLSRCLHSLEQTTYRNYRVTIINNDSDNPETLQLFDETPHSILHVSSSGSSFNFSNLVNQGVEQSETPYVLLLNDDTEVLNTCWLSQMVGLLRIDGVGAVGAKLIFPNETIQHAGIIHGADGGYAGHAFRGACHQAGGYLSYLQVPRNYSAVTAACLLTSRELYLKLGGFDETDFAVAYNDVDFGYRLTQSGKRCIYCPDAQLIHREGSSRGFVDNPVELGNFLQKYGDYYDGFYNPNLSLENELFEISPRRIPPPGQSPARVLAVTHNLNLEGAPKCLLNILCRLTDKGLIRPFVVSLADGPLANEYEKAGIPILVLSFSGQNLTLADYESHLSAWSRHVRINDFDVVFANTLDTYFAIDAAKIAKVPSVWHIHESLAIESLFENLHPSTAQRAYDCFIYPYRVIFVAEATANLYKSLNTKANFTVIRNALIESGPKKNQDLDATEGPHLPDDEKLILCVGTVCARKRQLDLLSAFEMLPESLTRSTTIALVGALPNDYGKSLLKRVHESQLLQKKVILTGVQNDPEPWYERAHAYVCCSSSESYSLVILEAMNAGLPIITTPVFGIIEQVMENINALFYQPSDISGLKNALFRMLTDQEMHDSFAKASPQVLRAKGNFNDLIRRYEAIIKEAKASR